MVRKHWFEVWGHETAQNQFLKGLVALLLAVGSVQSVVLSFLAYRPPSLVTISSSESRFIENLDPKSLIESEVKRAVRKYLAFRHSWTWETIRSGLRDARRFIAEENLKSYDAVVDNLVKAATEKKLSQKLFFEPLEMRVSTESKTVSVFVERLLIVDKLRAASPLHFEVKFEYGQRTPENPEGIYVTSDEPIEAEKLKE